MAPQGECMLVIPEATPKGKGALAGFRVGVGERAQSWPERLVDIKVSGLKLPARDRRRRRGQEPDRARSN